jgi:hypothetical protein
MDDDDFRDDLKEYSDKDAQGEKMDYEGAETLGPIDVMPFSDLSEIDEDIQKAVTEYISQHLDDEAFIEEHMNLYAILNEMRRDAWLSPSMSNVVAANISEDEKRRELANRILTALENLNLQDQAIFNEVAANSDKFREIITEVLTTMMLG